MTISRILPVLALVVACRGSGASRITLSSSEVVIGTYEGAMAPPKGVEVTYPGTRLHVTAPDATTAPWLSVDVSDYRGSAVLQIVTDASKVTTGTYSAVLTLGPVGGDAIDLPITFTVWDAFRLSTNQLDVPLTLDGASSGPGATLGVTGAQARWQVRGAPTWLRFDPAAADGSRDVDVRCELSAFTGPGVLTAELRLADTVGGREVPLSVRCIADTHRLRPARRGVAFSQFPNAAALSADVAIAHNGGGVLDWSASASTPWLSVTAAGHTGEAMHIAADPTGLAAGVHTATVTIRSDARTIHRAETVRVGLYVSPVPLANPVVLRDAAASKLGDPIRPYRYVQVDGARVEARNLYTAALERTYPLPTSTAGLWMCDVSDDGRYLFLEGFVDYDPSNPFAYYAREVWRVDLDDETAPPRLLFTEMDTKHGYSNSTFPVRYVTNNGVPLLVNPIGRVHRADTGEVLTSFLWNWNGTSDQPYMIYDVTLVSLDPSGEYVAFANAEPSIRAGVHLYRIHAYDAVPFASVTLDAVVAPRASVQTEGLLLGRDLDRVYVRFGYFEKVGTAWILREKFTTAQRFLDGGNGVLIGIGVDAARDVIVGEYTKDGDLTRKLSQGSDVGWNYPLLSSDGLMVFVTTDDRLGPVTYGYRR